MQKKESSISKNNVTSTTPVEHDKRILSRLQLFRNVDLEDSAIDYLLSQCVYRELEDGDSLLSIDKTNHHLYVVIRGRCAIQLGYFDEMPLATVEPGECVGEMSIIDSRVPSATVIATESTRVLEIEQDILWRMVSHSHEVARNLLYIMSERVRYSNLVIADSLEQQRKFQHHATIDALTGLHNRGWMNDVFAREIQRSEREDLSLCLMMLDVDFFKQYNDKYGHLAGDRVLMSVGEAAYAPLRTNDLLARYGGEEFSVLLPETKMEQALIVAERLRQRISDTDPGILDGVQLPKITISIGIAEYRPGYTLETLIAAADVAMYQAKNNGRNCVRIATNA
ncbi:MAG: GGDEF domain-containing protein [Gammaproteobacteria bacterium]|nr:GGDEF domain-containing protein [Gammaproteobacteria bacterium]